MRLVLCVQYILLLIHPATTHTVSSFYQYCPGLVWDDCMEPVSGALSKCAIMCSESSVCLGINFLGDAKATRPCQLCISSATKSVSKASSSSSPFMYFRLNTVNYRPPGNEIYFVDLPNGIVDGQVILLRTRIDFTEKRLHMMFLESASWTKPHPECDLLIDMRLDDIDRPNTIVLDNYDSARRVWAGPFIKKPADDFLVDGTDASILIFVNQLTYTVYIDGRPFYDYPRSQRRSLGDIKYVRLDGSWPYIQLAL